MSRPRRGFVPDDFVVPAQFATPEFRLRMLTIHDVVQDYEAVISSVAHLRSVWPDSEWPQGLTLEQNLIDLGWHQKEFQRRSSFAYTVVAPDESRVVGCVYLYPSTRRGYDAEVYLWARQSELASGLEQRLYASVQDWIARDWPFGAVAYPGRDIDWDSWHALAPH